MTKHPLIGVLLLIMALTATSGCSSNDPDVLVEDSGHFPYARLAPSAPPAAPYEEKYQTEFPMQEVWRAGYWTYDGKQFSWNQGRYILRPEPTAIWIPDRWEQKTFGWAFIPGHWQ